MRMNCGNGNNFENPLDLLDDWAIIGFIDYLGMNKLALVI